MGKAERVSDEVCIAIASPVELSASVWFFPLYLPTQKLLANLSHYVLAQQDLRRVLRVKDSKI